MTLIILSVVLALVFIVVGAIKVRMIPQMFELARRLGIHYTQFRITGGIEIILAIMVLAGIRVGWLGATGALLLTLDRSIAILSYARANGDPKRYALAAAAGILAFILFLAHLYQ